MNCEDLHPALPFALPSGGLTVIQVGLPEEGWDMHAVHDELMYRRLEQALLGLAIRSGRPAVYASTCCDGEDIRRLFPTRLLQIVTDEELPGDIPTWSSPILDSNRVVDHYCDRYPTFRAVEAAAAVQDRDYGPAMLVLDSAAEGYKDVRQDTATCDVETHDPDAHLAERLATLAVTRPAETIVVWRAPFTRFRGLVEMVGVAVVWVVWQYYEHRNRADLIVRRRDPGAEEWGPPTLHTVTWAPPTLHTTA